MKKLYLFFYLLSSVPVMAQFCSPLDGGFGANGVAVNYQLTSNNRVFEYRSILIQGPGGKILQVAHAFGNSDDWIVMQQFLSNGQKDLSFGTNGVALFDSAGAYYDAVDALYLPDGSFLLAGFSYITSKSSGWITRVKANGKEDFDFKQKASANPLVRDERTSLRSISRLPDGRILVAGSRFNQVTVCGEPGFYPAVMLTCLLPDGTTDSGFGDQGVVNVQSGSTINQNPLLSVLDNGRFLLASEVGADCSCVTDAYYGNTYLGCNRQDLLIQRFDNSGKPDLSFGNQGKLLDSTGSVFLRAIRTQSDQKILALSGSEYLSLRRYLPDGSRDLGFGQGGVVDFSKLLNAFNENALELTGFVTQEDGKIMVVGTAYKFDNFFRPVFVRLESDGRIDTSFSETGWVSVIETGKQYNAGLQAISKGNGQVITGGKRLGPDAIEELFVSALSTTQKRIYPDITPSRDLTLCFNDSASVLTRTSGSYQWYRNSEPLLGVTQSAIQVKNFSGAFAVNVVNNSGCGLSPTVIVATRPEIYPGLIQWSGTELVANDGFVRYQWYLDNAPIAGATSARYNPGTTLGTYTFRGWDQYDCSVLSSRFSLVITGVSDVTLGDAQIRFFPNPVRSTLIIQHRSGSIKRASFELYDVTGRKILEQSLRSGRNPIELGGYKNGMYTIILRHGQDQISRKLMILHD